VLKENQLAKQPLCERCSTDDGRWPPPWSTTRIPHRGDRRLFRDPENHESVCKPCHDGPIQREERLGFSPRGRRRRLAHGPKHPIEQRPPMKRDTLSALGEPRNAWLCHCVNAVLRLVRPDLELVQVSEFSNGEWSPWRLAFRRVWL
jgi:5-methylcytosine-specific restriction protein A